MPPEDKGFYLRFFTNWVASNGTYCLPKCKKTTIFFKVKEKYIFFLLMQLFRKK
jgi:hypothetical protein